ncbi:MAG: thiamine phosphate synthase [Leptospiraceae bacterium]|nr:thiamine phosphate synthase [Leptospiraceae bacterium]
MLTADYQDLLALWKRSHFCFYQLRFKGASFPATLALATTLKRWEPNLRLIANDMMPAIDHPEVFDGLHLGQQDLAACSDRELQRLLGRRPNFELGISTHDLAELRNTVALHLNPDYIAVGPCYSTDSKLDTNPVLDAQQLLAMLSAIEKEESLPARIVFIGGLNTVRIGDCLQKIASWRPGGPARSLQFQYAGIAMFRQAQEIQACNQMFAELQT